MKLLKLANKYDYFLLIFFLFIFLFLIIAFSQNNTMGETVSIYVDGKLYDEVPLDIDTTIIVDDGIHRNTIVVENEKAYVKEANCPDQICTRANPIFKDKEIIVCLPNKVYIEINSKNNEIDSFVS